MTSAPAYQGAWRRISEQLRAAHPYCSMCHVSQGEHYLDDLGRERTVHLSVDHINADPRDNRRENLRVLCSACHESLTSDNWRR